MPIPTPAMAKARKRVGNAKAKCLGRNRTENRVPNERARKPGSRTVRAWMASAPAAARTINHPCCDGEGKPWNFSHGETSLRTTEIDEKSIYPVIKAADGSLHTTCMSN